MPEKQILWQVDSFTEEALQGNPAGVCVLDSWPSEVWLQLIAREMNLSETAYIVRSGDDWELRWFTPLVEVDLCGHATLAAAHILWQEGYLQSDQEARFQTRSGILRAKREQDWIVLDFPAYETVSCAPNEDVLAALNVPIVAFGQNKSCFLVETESEAWVRKANPDFSRLLKVPLHVELTSRAEGDEYDFVSRVFAPSVGINEDPVTGSAHCTLGPYWATRLGKQELRAYQASARGGELIVRVFAERVQLLGHAVSIFKLQLL